MKVAMSLVLLVAAIPALALAPARAQEENEPLDVEVVATLTGPDGINETHTKYGVDGTDLGHTFEHDGAIYMVFGDTFGPAKSDWRSNVAAVIETDQDPRDGLTFDRMITDLPDHAKQLISPRDVEGTEVTIIPTYGVSVGDRMFLHYMAVREWGDPGRWDLNLSGLAYSDDDGENWTVDSDATWAGDSNFGQVAIVQLDGYAYFFGIPGGRFGGTHVARVSEEQILEKSAYEYWDGAAWMSDEAAAELLIPAPVGELSVRWNSHYEQWLMMYLNEDKYSVVLRTADCLTGPWSEEWTVATGAEYPQLYAPYILPRWNDGPEIYFTMSLFGPYQVYLMQTALDDVEPSTGDPECVSPGAGA
ncbi:MAG: DUF4185 domain-containing protein [Thermomicrobiales bacterium]